MVVRLHCCVFQSLFELLTQNLTLLVNTLKSIVSGRLSEVADNLTEKPAVGIELRHVPHHDTAEAGELLGVGNGGFEFISVSVTTTSSGVGWDAEESFDVGVLAALSPLIPDIKVECVLSIRTWLEVGDTAPVVIKLDHNKVKGNGVKGRPNSSIREDALRSSGKIELLTTSTIHQAPELGPENRKIAGR